MKKMHEKRRRVELGKMQEMRMTMAKEAMSASKLGDPKKCDPAVPKTEKIKYCNENFDDDPDMNSDCKDPE